MKQNKLPLPIDSAIGEILNRAANYSVVIIKASPGSGKTTRLPWAIARGLSKKVAVLEPRRLAAKLAAQRIADEENLTLGNEVGHHFRFEKKTSPDTQVTFYTEGTFLRKFLSSSELDDIGVVILDEFHERHIETDLALALCRDLQKKKDLKIILMSATLDTRLTEFFPDSSLIEVEGKAFPVEINYLPNRPSVLNQSLEAKVKKAVDSSEGDTLVFLPGMREMQRVQNVLTGDYLVYLLHADLSREEQSAALLSSQERKIILSTNIAESSVTIPGIKVVIDSGIQREAYFSPWNGLKLIHDVPVTKSSATQRAGRAGRTGPGTCLRLYSEQDFNEREEYTIPEIRKADLLDIFLMIKGSGLTPEWFEAPPEEKWLKAKELLSRLGAMDGEELTPIGKKLLSYPLDARLARALIECENSSLREKEKLLNYIVFEVEGDKSGTLKKRLSSFLKQSGDKEIPWEKCLLTGFINQVGKFRPKQRDFIHYSGKIIKAHHGLSDLQEGLYLIMDITQRQEAIKVLPIEEEWPWDLKPFPFTEEEEIKIDKQIIISTKTKLGSIVIDESVKKAQWSQLTSETQAKIKDSSQNIIKKMIEEFQSTRFYEKFAFWSKFENIDTKAIFQQINLDDYFSQNNLSFENFAFYLRTLFDEILGNTGLDQLLPDKLNLGGRRDLTIHYPENNEPFIEAPLQDFYGLSKTPALMNGKIQLTLKLLGPHRRPIQITKDLESFWHKTYQEMKKEYQREYPRHYWPDRPWEAKPYLLKSHLPKA